MLRFHTYPLPFAHSLVFGKSISIESPTAPSAWNQVASSILPTVLCLKLIPVASRTDRLFGLLRVLAHWSFVHKGLLDHRIPLAGLLMRNQWFLVKLSPTVLALYQPFLHKSIKRLSVKVVYVCPCDFVLRNQLLKPRRSLRTWSALLRRLLILLVFPLFLACLNVDAETLGSKPKSQHLYSLPHM